ncbi:MAG TPA: dihydrolipoyllysine-residue acetyltransferase [Candidatus Baltobacteraceae bacterium]|nr:dihydrolipoyllysine-residue acetyltransferase [Candidatus Baltobacteraceae bacterium]
MADTLEVRVPDIGDFKDVPVIEVLVKPGDRIKKDDSLVTLESEKASMEVPSEREGVVKDVSVKVGDRVSKGTVLLTLEGAPAGRAPQDDKAHHAEVQPEESPRSAGAQTIELRVPDLGDFKDIPVIDVLVKPGDRIEKEAPLVTLESEKASMDIPASAGGTIEDVRVKAGDKVSRGTVIATIVAPSVGGPSSFETPAARAPQDDVPQPPKAPSNGIIHASPAIRRFARELGVDLHGVSGSGPHGRVTREDVQGFVKRALTQSGASAGTATFAGLPAWPKVDFAQYGPIERKPLPRIKKFSGPNLHRNWLQIPHITNYDEADITDLEVFRNEVNAEQSKTGAAKLTMLAFLIKASVAALARYPDFNTSLDGEELVYKRYYNVGFAADTPNGLVVPVLKDADKKGLLEIARESAELAAKARDGKLGMAEMQGGTFTISSIGGIGGTQFTQIVNAPEVAILGATRAATKPVWDGSAFVPRLILPISVSYDHRVIDGAGAARFLVYLASLLRDFRRVSL